MGSSASRPSPLAPTFERMASWDIKAAKRLLADYKDKDLDFGLDAQSLAEICGGDHGWADAIIDAFGGTNGIVNALAYICGAILVSSGAALEKAGLVFDALDFDLTEQISMDEMTIVFLCCARGYCVMSGTGAVPTDEALEHVTLQAYRELSKSGGHSITKTEFTKWVLHFISAVPSHGEASLEDMAIQFGLVAVPPVKTVTEPVRHEIAEENNAVAGDETGEEDMAEPPPQEETPVAEDELLPGDEPTEAEVLAQRQDKQEDTEEQEAVAAEAAGEAAAELIEVNQDQGNVEVPIVFNEYDDEFQAESPRDDGDTMERPPSPPVEQAEEDLQAPPEIEFVNADPVGDQQAREETAPDAETGPTSGDGEPAGDDPQADLNAYDTYDYADPTFDSSSGLSPPDPFEAQDPPVVSAEPTPRAAVDETDTVTTN